MVDDRLSMALTSTAGQVRRWGADERAGEDIPEGLQFSTQLPGGFKDCGCSLFRRIDLDYPDLGLLDDVTVYGPGNEIAFEGRMVQFPRSHGDSFQVAPAAVGYSAHLQDDPSFLETYVDRDLAGFGDISRSRRIALLASWSIEQSGVVADSSTGLPAIEQRIAAVSGGGKGVRPICETAYDAGAGTLIETVTGELVTTANIFGTFEAYVRAHDDDSYAAGEESADIITGSPGTYPVAYTPASPRRVVTLAFLFNGTTGFTAEFPAYWRKLALIGDHGLPKQGVAPDQGFYASDVIADVVSRAAPLLTFTTGDGGSISPSNFVIPQLAFKTPVSAEEALQHVNAYHLYEWGVYEGRQFFWRPTDPDRLTWQARLSDGAHLELEGDAANDIYNGVFVSYQDFDGTQKTVGPPFASADATDALLGDTDPANPVNAHGIPRRWAKLDLSVPTTLAGATAIGVVWLAERSLPARRGTITLTGQVDHPTAGKQPPWKVRAGDWIRVSDHPADVARRIVATSYNHDARTVSCEVGNDIQKLDAVLERAGIQLQGLVT